MPSLEQYFFHIADIVYTGMYAAYVNAHGIRAAQPQLNSQISAMANAGFGKGTIQQYAYGYYFLQQASRRQKSKKLLRSAPGPQGMGAGGAYANFKNIKYGNGLVRQS